MGKRKWKRRAKAWGATVQRQSEHITLLTERLDASEAAQRNLQANWQTQVDIATGLQAKLDAARADLEVARATKASLEAMVAIIEAALPQQPGVIVKDPGDRWPDLRPTVRRLNNELHLAIRKLSPSDKGGA